MSWKSLLLEAVIMAITAFATVFFRGVMANYAPNEDFV